MTTLVAYIAVRANPILRLNASIRVMTLYSRVLQVDTCIEDGDFYWLFGPAIFLIEVTDDCLGLIQPGFRRIAPSILEKRQRRDGFSPVKCLLGIGMECPTLFILILFVLIVFIRLIIIIACIITRWLATITSSTK